MQISEPPCGLRLAPSPTPRPVSASALPGVWGRVTRGSRGRQGLGWRETHAVQGWRLDRQSSIFFMFIEHLPGNRHGVNAVVPEIRHDLDPQGLHSSPRTAAGMCPGRGECRDRLDVGEEEPRPRSALGRNCSTAQGRAQVQSPRGLWVHITAHRCRHPGPRPQHQIPPKLPAFGGPCRVPTAGVHNPRSGFLQVSMGDREVNNYVQLVLFLWGTLTDPYFGITVPEILLDR